ncbi:Cleavage stimulation factor subunit 3 [Toxocara canis]|uniref:Cleavage stimulation factor subunit 3 n=2 Tax=Toxocara canis TaxID=6265 RepID=A0A0B2VJZ9_TOXCA|nr:Cleavage stimulation factor subunit 3 [Toxocara canis]
MSALSIVSPERRIELNPFDVDAWNLLLRESQLRGKNYENVEALFGRCLIHVLNIDLWKCYVYYVRETKGHLSSFREKMAQAYEFALDKVGMDMHSYSIYSDYISFLKSAPTVGQYAENQRISAVRKIYQRGIVTPMVNIEQLWAEYCSYEKASPIFDPILATNDRQEKLFERAIGGLLKDSQLLFFAYADFEEERMKYDNVKKIYDKLLAIEQADPTLAYIQLMKFVRRTEGAQFARNVFKRARQDPRCKFHVYVASALMEYYCSKDTDVAIRVFDMGLKKYGDEPDYALAYVDFLSHLNEDNNTRVVFERILTSGTMPPEKSLEIWDRYLEFESEVGDLSSILKVDQRRREALKEQYGEMQTLLLIDRYKFLNLVPCTGDQLKLMGYSKQLKQGSSLVGRASSSAGTATLLSGSANANGSTRSIPVTAQGPSVVMGGGVSLEISGYPRPDTDQMIPFKPKLNTTASFHPVPGGIFPPPPAAAQLMQTLPPPWCFNGPFVSVDLLIESLSKFAQTGPPTVDVNVKLENGVMFGKHRVEDLKKDFYQLVATTTDPNVVLASSEYQQQQSALAARKRRAAGGDSDSDEETPRATGVVRDIYKRRMNAKAHD